MPKDQRLTSLVRALIPAGIRARVPVGLKRRFRGWTEPAPDKPLDPEGWDNIYGYPPKSVTGLTSPIAQVIVDLTAPNDFVFETGCGSAEISAQLGWVGRRIALADFSQSILGRAEAVFVASALTPPLLVNLDLAEVPWPIADRSFDVTWSSGVLEHWTDEEIGPIVSEMARVSRKMVISLVPNSRCVFYRLGKHVAEQTRTWPYGRELPRSTLRQVFEAAGLEHVQEWDIMPREAASFLDFVDPELSHAARQWHDGLTRDDPAMAGQGYLLVTIGEVKT